MKKYINKVKERYKILKPMRIQTSVYNQPADFIKKSLFVTDDIKEETGEDIIGDGTIESIDENEEKEESTKEEKKNQLKNNNDIKVNVFYGNTEDSNKNNKENKRKKILGKSLRNDTPMMYPKCMKKNICEYLVFY